MIRPAVHLAHHSTAAASWSASAARKGCGRRRRWACCLTPSLSMMTGQPGRVVHQQ